MPDDRLFATRVARVTRVSPTFTRVTVTGESLAGFAGHGFDQRINLVLLPPEADVDDWTADPDWYGRWRATPTAHRPPVRTYTVRAFRPDRRELDVDFVLHGAGGPASRWATRARPGTPLTIAGPVAGGPITDVAWAPPPDAGPLLLAADEAALPAASAILEALPAGTRATAVLEVPEPADAVGPAVPAGVDLVWLARSRGERLEPVVRDLLAGVGWGLVPDTGPRRTGHPAGPADAGTPEGDDEIWEVPEPVTGTGGCYAWLAGESGTVVALRRHLVGEQGVDRRSVAFMGYWRRGRAQPN